MSVPRELSDEGARDQAEAFLDFAAKLGGPWQYHLAFWLKSKDIGREDARAILQAITEARAASSNVA
jgi:hypothetical protein